MKVLPTLLLAALLVGFTSPLTADEQCQTHNYNCISLQTICTTRICQDSNTGAQTSYYVRYCDGWCQFIDENGNGSVWQGTPCSSEFGAGGDGWNNPWGDNFDFFTWMNIAL